MRIGAVVLSRYDSRRLPGKTLADVRGQPLLWYCIERCRAVEALEGRIVVATTDRGLDDPIARWASDQGLAVYRGAADDVAARFLGAAEAERYDAAARINADCPLADPMLISQACEALTGDDVDFVTNLRPRNYPYGIVVELFRTGVFARGYAEMTLPDHFEHITKYFYDTAGSYRFLNLNHPGGPEVAREMLRHRLTVDTPEHLARFRAFVAQQNRPWAEVDYMDAVSFGGFGAA